MSRAPGPPWTWFVQRAMRGFGPRIALVDAAVAAVTAIVAAAVWRASAGPRGPFEQIVPMLGSGLRWSVALPAAWGALRALQDDREDGLLDLAQRRGVSMRRWILGRALGAGGLVAVLVGGPMILVSLVIAGFGGGLAGFLHRGSLVFPSLVVATATGAVFGLGGVVLSVLVPSRWLALAILVAGMGLGVLSDAAIPGIAGVAAHELMSPLLALEDLQAMLFARPGSEVRGILAVVTLVVLSLGGLRAAESALSADHREIA